MTFPAQERVELPVTGDLARSILAATASLPGADYRVLMSYVTAVPLGETIRETAQDVAAFLKISPGTVSRSLKKLTSTGWLEVSYRVGTVPFYKAGPQVLEMAQAEASEGMGHEQPLAQVHHLPVRSTDGG
ncbi:helix-turn-helix domain-containing protein [Streptomyces sp. NBC_00829]|uniref:MarR family transcriptional regulator n=1 Tax=Streptomyces sp. NBC_00829 TaxID=2903679 RepID=UPI002F91B672|nr:MarR family transcriptional regulator [Streptomyces sp. NBC_00829]